MATRITKWKWHVKTGYREFQRQAAVRAALVAAGEKIASAAGGEEDGFQVQVESSSGSRGTPRVAVVTGTPEAMRLEAEERRLTRALDAGRG